MSDETRKANLRRLRDPLYDVVFRGRGIQVGSGNDVLNQDRLFPGIDVCDLFDGREKDLEDGPRHQPSDYDFVYSSHCLEHLSDPARALRSWFDLVRPGGFLVLVVPDEDLFEQGNWPSTFDTNHRWTFTICKTSSWSPRSINLLQFVAQNLSGFSFTRVMLADTGFDYSIYGKDQSRGRAEVSIELILRKQLPRDRTGQGRVDLEYLCSTGRILGNPQNLDGRLPTVRTCIDRLLEQRPRVFVEAGCQSTSFLRAHGMSTAIWAEVATRCGGRLWTVDRNHEAVKQCRLLTAAYNNIEYVLADSVMFLQTFEKGIDFLYLDSCDFHDGWEDVCPRHQLAELEAAYPKLVNNALVLLDDARIGPDSEGPTFLAHRFLNLHGAHCLADIPSSQRLYRIRK